MRRIDVTLQVREAVHVEAHWATRHAIETKHTAATVSAHRKRVDLYINNKVMTVRSHCQAY